MTKRTREDAKDDIDQMRAEAVKRLSEAFKEKFGREMRPGDPLFWDPAASEPRPLAENPRSLEATEAVLLEAMVAAGTSPELIYAYRQTGLLASEDNWDLLSEEDQAAWNAAINDYYEKTRNSQ